MQAAAGRLINKTIHLFCNNFKSSELYLWML